MSRTRFEAEWENPAMHIFKSDEHGVMAVADMYPRMPLSCVIAPRDGTPGERLDFYELPSRTKRHLFEVADAIGQKILPHCNSEQRAALRINNFSVGDHPHIIVSAATRDEIVGDYNALRELGVEAVQHTLTVMRFSQAESAELEARLARIA